MSDNNVVDLLQQILVRLDGIDTRLRRVEKTVNATQEHVANIDERLTQTEKVKELFRPEVLEKIKS